MLDYRENEIIIVEALRSYLRSKFPTCEVVRQNQISKAPAYPYVSYTVISPVGNHTGTYSETVDGTLYKDILQTWSFTSQSNDQEEAMIISMMIYDFFSALGLVPLADKNITVRRVGNITTRDNLLTIEYEYRNGLDVVFGLLYAITPDNGVIETMSFKEV